MIKSFANKFCFWISPTKLRHSSRNELSVGSFEEQFRRLNPHNEMWAESWFDLTKVSVGKRSYGPLWVYTSGTGSEMLKIGNYVSVGPNVHFIVASEHPYSKISTFPFKVKLKLQKFEAGSKGDIIVDDDVHIGLGAIINSGVHIGQGAVIASGAVVVKDVKPYAIVGGNPAKVIKYRFQAEMRKKLLKLDFSKLDENWVKNNIDKVYAKLTTKNIDALIKKIQGL